MNYARIIIADAHSLCPHCLWPNGHIVLAAVQGVCEFWTFWPITRNLYLTTKCWTSQGWSCADCRKKLLLWFSPFFTELSPGTGSCFEMHLTILTSLHLTLVAFVRGLNEHNEFSDRHQLRRVYPFILVGYMTLNDLEKVEGDLPWTRCAISTLTSSKSWQQWDSKMLQAQTLTAYRICL